MKKIILLETLLTLVIIAVVIFIGVEVYGLTLVSTTSQAVTASLIFMLVTHLIFFTGLVMARMALSSFITRGFFSRTGFSFLRKSGLLMISYGMLWGMDAFVFSTISAERVIEYLFCITILLVGLGLIVIADIVAKGEALENENNLTI